MTIRSVLAVCTGNICRSPMAEALLAIGLPSVQVRSAGLGALVGEPADRHARALMQERGISIEDHRAQQINRMLCQSADLILVMETAQRRQLETMYPFASGRVFRLDEAAGMDIPDPYRGSRGLFGQVLTLIDRGVQQWIQRISRVTSR